MLMGVAAATGGHAAEPLPTLSEVAAIRRLPAEEARKGYPVRIRAVVTFYGSPTTLFVQDRTAGVFIDRGRQPTAVHPGDLVEITGVTGAGFATQVMGEKVTVLGRAPFPPSRLLHYEDLALGAMDSQWVEIRGVVRSATIVRPLEQEYLALDIETGAGRVVTRIRHFPREGLAGLVDAVVRVRGVCGSRFNPQKQFLGVRLFVIDMSHVVVERPGPGDPFSLPAVGLASVGVFQPDADPVADTSARRPG